MHRPLLAFLFLTTPAVAQPVGIGTCDAFIAAYEKCAATVPEPTRAALIDGINNMRTLFRDAGNSSAAARKTVTAQCVQTHELTRPRLIEAFKCDFPPPGPITQADAPFTPPKTPAKPPQDPAEPTRAKTEAYIEAQNGLVEHRSLDKDLAEYIRNNERVLRLGTKLGADAWFSFGINDLDRDIERLDAAIALPGAVPQVDPAAVQLRAALQAVNPIIKTLDRYQTTRGFKEDGFKLLQAQNAAFVSGMRGAIKALDLYAGALFDMGLARDETRLAAMTQGSLAERLLSTSLSTRRLLNHYQRYQPGDDLAPLTAALSAVARTNTALHAAIDALQPKPDSYCNGYAREVDTVLGYGRDIARDLKARSNPGSTSDQFIGAYNKTIDYHQRCEEREARARG